MSISEQVKELMELSDGIDEDGIRRYYGLCLETALGTAADAIESLSAKLADMERTAENCCGGWIYCGDGKNLPEERTDVLVSFEDNHNPLVAWYSSINNHWKNSCTDNAIRTKVIAWQPLPEPYHEP